MLREFLNQILGFMITEIVATILTVLVPKPRIKILILGIGTGLALIIAFGPWWPPPPPGTSTSASMAEATSTPTGKPPVPPTETRTKTPSPSPTPPTRPPGPLGEMVHVPAGDFLMGSTTKDIDIVMNLCLAHDPCNLAWFTGEQPQHTVYLDAFFIDKNEVTNAQYGDCVAAGKCSPHRESKSPTRATYYGNEQFNSYPVIYVLWQDAKAYCEWAGKRLPTEAEWEKAASWDDTRKEKRIFPWGNEWDTKKAKSLESPPKDTVAVGSYPLGESPYHAMDMAGNVFEWVWDWWDGDEGTYYGNSPRDNPMGAASGISHVLRGGAYDRWPSALRTTQRYGYYNAATSGFRCAKR